MSTTTITFSLSIAGIATNATSVVISDSTGLIGLTRTDTGATVVAVNTALVNTSTGHYSYAFTDPSAGLTYHYWIKYVVSGVTYYQERTATAESDVEPDCLTVAQAKVLIPSLANTPDATLNVLLPVASQEARNIVKHGIMVANRVEYRNGNGNDWIRLYNYPIQSITQFTMDYDQSPVVVASTEFQFDKDTGVVRFDPDSVNKTGFKKGFQNIKIEYVGGYLVGEVPADIQMAVSLLMQGFIRATNTPHLTGKSVGNISLSYSPLMTAVKTFDMYALAKQILTKYTYRGYIV